MNYDVQVHLRQSAIQLSGQQNAFSLLNHAQLNFFTHASGVVSEMVSLKLCVKLNTMDRTESKRCNKRHRATIRIRNNKKINKRSFVVGFEHEFRSFKSMEPHLKTMQHRDV